jgi:hypothetical protein
MKKRPFTVHNATRFEPSPCTSCGKILDGGSGVVEGEEAEHEMRPMPGAVTVCIACGHIMAFDEQLRLRDLTDAEAIEVAGNPVVLAIQRARGAIK